MVVKEQKPGRCARCNRKLKAIFIVGNLTFGPICVKKLGLGDKVDKVIPEQEAKEFLVKSKQTLVKALKVPVSKIKYDDLSKWLT